MNRKTVSGVLLIHLFLILAVSAQNYRGLIRGRITDSQGAAISGARLAVRYLETGEKRTATTDAQGDYAVSLLRPGIYQVEIEQSGFNKFSASVNLEVNQDRRLDISLSVGTVKEGQEVKATNSVLRLENASLGAVIDNRQVAGLPLDGRNFLELSLLVPGTVPAAQGSAGSVRGDFAFSLNGAREDANNFLLDGFSRPLVSAWHLTKFSP